MSKFAKLSAPGPQSSRNCGVSLIELMIALVLGMVVLLAVGEVYVGSRQTYRTQDALSRLQENARYAIETLSYDIRMAGQVGCSVDLTQSVNELNVVTYGDLLGTTLRGYDKGATVAAPFTASLAKADAIQIFRADAGNETLVQSHNAATSTFTFPVATPFSKGDILVVTDCSTAGIFQASNPASAGTTLEHKTGGGLTPGNCSNNLGPKPAVGDPCTAATVKAFPAGSKVMPLEATLYYIANNPAGQPSLYRQRLVKGAPVTEELVEGVEDMQIQYGLDTTGDKSVDSYVNATGVTYWGPPPTLPQVVSIRISLLMRTTEDNVANENQTYTFNGVATTAADRRIRQVFTSTIGARVRI